MKARPTHSTDGLEWLRAVRRKIQGEIGITPQERVAYYQTREKKLAARLYSERAVQTSRK